jgi:Tol biopolymer transport system component
VSDHRSVLERASASAPPPDLPFERVLERRDRVQRNRRIRAGVLGVGVAIAVGWLGINAIRSAPVPADDPRLPELRRGAEYLRFEPMGLGYQWDLTAEDPATGERRTIVETDGIVDCPNTQGCRTFVREADWSADGRWIAFEVSYVDFDGPALGPCAPTVGIWVTNALGELRQLTTPCDERTRSELVEEVWEWSPVGARLAYARVDGETDELVVIDPADGARTSVATADIPATNSGIGTTSGWAMEWSPDGERLAYADGSSVSVVDSDGGEPSLLADGFEDVIEIAWSPGGSHLMVHDEARYRIQVMNADGSDLHPVLEDLDPCCDSAAWSPSGDRILTQLSDTDREDNPDQAWHSEVWTVSPDGSDPIELFNSSECGMGGLIDSSMSDALPAWSPDGSQVGYFACDRWLAESSDGTGEPYEIDRQVWRSWNSSGISGDDLAANGQFDN